MGKSKGHLQQQAGAGATKDKTKGQLQQLAVLNAISTSLATTLSTENLPVSNPVLPVSNQSSLANVNSPAKRGPPKDRSSPGSLTFKKRKTAASSSSLAEVAGVEELEENASTSGASKSDFNESSSETSHPAAGQEELQLAASSSKRSHREEIDEKNDGDNSEEADGKQEVLQVPASSGKGRHRAGKDGKGESENSASSSDDSSTDSG